MDQNTDGSKPSNADSENHPSTAVAPKLARSTAKATKAEEEVEESTAPSAPNNSIDRWSEGTFGRPAASGQSSLGDRGSSFYSGKSEEALEAQTSTAKVVNIGKGRLKEGAQRGEAGADTTSADVVTMFGDIDDDTLELLMSSAKSTQERRA